MTIRAILARRWLPVTLGLSLLAPVVSAQITIQSAMYGQTQTAAPGYAGARCYTAGPTNLTAAANSYCGQNAVGDTCVYTVPWPGPGQDPGVGCYKNFTAVYKCPTFQNPKTIEIGGRMDEAANQKVVFDCAPMRVGVVSFSKIAADSQPFNSNGNVATAWYKINAKNNYGADYEGAINISTRVKPASSSDREVDKSKNYLNCSGTPTITTNASGKANLGLEYKVTGYQVTGDPSSGISTSQVDFSLKVNGAPCTGAFEYTQHSEPPVEGNFFVVVNNAEIPLDITYAPPATATPVFKMTDGWILNSMGFGDAILGLRTRYFDYDFYYVNEYGLAASAGVSCTFGSSKKIAFTTSASGHLTVDGKFTLAEAGRDPSGSMTWNVTTTLDSSKPAFHLQKGKAIGAVTCSVDGTDLQYSQDLGTW